MNQEAEYKDKQALFIKLRKWDKVMRYMTILILLIIVANQNTAAQVKHEFGLGYNYYFSYLTERSKAHGITFRYGIEQKIYKRLFFNTSFCSNLTYDYQPKYFESTTTYNIDHYATANREKGGKKCYVSNLRVPINLMLKLYNNKLFFYAGASFTMDKLFVLGEIIGSDPEMGGETEYAQGIIGMGYQVGLSYALSKKIGVFSELKTNKNKYYQYFYTEFGIKYVLNKYK